MSPIPFRQGGSFESRLKISNHIEVSIFNCNDTVLFRVDVSMHVVDDGLEVEEGRK